MNIDIAHSEEGPSSLEVIFFNRLIVFFVSSRRAYLTVGCLGQLLFLLPYQNFYVTKRNVTHMVQM